MDVFLLTSRSKIKYIHTQSQARSNKDSARVIYVIRAFRKKHRYFRVRA